MRKIKIPTGRIIVFSDRHLQINNISRIISDFFDRHLLLSFMSGQLVLHVFPFVVLRFLLLIWDLRSAPNQFSFLYSFLYTLYIILGFSFFCGSLAFSVWALHKASYYALANNRIESTKASEQIDKIYRFEKCQSAVRILHCIFALCLIINANFVKSGILLSIDLFGWIGIVNHPAVSKGWLLLCFGAILMIDFQQAIGRLTFRKWPSCCLAIAAVLLFLVFMGLPYEDSALAWGILDATPLVNRLDNIPSLIKNSVLIMPILTWLIALAKEVMNSYREKTKRNSTKDTRRELLTHWYFSPKFWLSGNVITWIIGCFLSICCVGLLLSFSSDTDRISLLGYISVLASCTAAMGIIMHFEISEKALIESEYYYLLYHALYLNSIGYVSANTSEPSERRKANRWSDFFQVLSHLYLSVGTLESEENEWHMLHPMLSGLCFANQISKNRQWKDSTCGSVLFLSRLLSTYRDVREKIGENSNSSDRQKGKENDNYLESSRQSKYFHTEVLFSEDITFLLEQVPGREVKRQSVEVSCCAVESSIDTFLADCSERILNRLNGIQEGLFQTQNALEAIVRNNPNLDLREVFKAFIRCFNQYKDMANTIRKDINGQNSTYSVLGGTESRMTEKQQELVRSFCSLSENLNRGKCKSVEEEMDRVYKLIGAIEKEYSKDELVNDYIMLDSAKATAKKMKEPSTLSDSTNEIFDVLSFFYTLQCVVFDEQFCSILENALSSKRIPAEDFVHLIQTDVLAQATSWQSRRDCLLRWFCKDRRSCQNCIGKSNEKTQNTYIRNRQTLTLEYPILVYQCIKKRWPDDDFPSAVIADEIERYYRNLLNPSALTNDKKGQIKMLLAYKAEDKLRSAERQENYTLNGLSTSFFRCLEQSGLSSNVDLSKTLDISKSDTRTQLIYKNAKKQAEKSSEYVRILKQLQAVQQQEENAKKQKETSVASGETINAKQAELPHSDKEPFVYKERKEQLIMCHFFVEYLFSNEVEHVTEEGVQ